MKLTATPLVGLDTHTGDPAEIPAGATVEVDPGNRLHQFRVTAYVNGHDVVAYADPADLKD